MYFIKSVSLLAFFGIFLKYGVGQNLAKRSYVQNNIKIAEQTKEKECPDFDDIYPCYCTKSDGNLDLDCSIVEDYQQLQNVFLSHFPDKAFRTFTLRDTNIIEKIGNGLFQDLTFEIIELEQLTSFTHVDELAFIGSLFTLKQLRIVYTLLNELTFPFDILKDFTQISRIEFYGNQIKSLPKLDIPTLTWMSFSSNFITNLDNDTFKLVPNIENILLSDNNITTILSGTFDGLDNLSFLSLFDNQISEVQNYSIVLNKGDVYLYSNNITTLEDHSIHGASFVNLGHNSIRKLLSEDAWKTIFEDAEEEGSVDLTGNSLDCGCDMLFLVTNLLYMRKLNPETKCGNGILVVNLDPENYIDICS